MLNQIFNATPGAPQKGTQIFLLLHVSFLFLYDMLITNGAGFGT
jgi:hypothetical protein